MRDRTIFRPLGIVTLLVATHTVSPAIAQQTQTELLQAIVCEIRELRSVIQQGQIIAPLLEANRRERELTSRQLAEAEGQLRQARTEVQKSLTMQERMSTALRELARSGDNQQERNQLELQLKTMEQQIQESQGEEARLVSEAGRIRARLSQLEGEFDGMRRQMQAVAATTGSVCEVASQTP